MNITQMPAINNEKLFNFITVRRFRIGIVRNVPFLSRSAIIPNINLPNVLVMPINEIKSADSDFVVNRFPSKK